MGKIIFLFVVFIALLTEFSNAGLPPTSTQGNGESSYSTTFKFNFPNITVSRTGTTTTFNTVNVAGGGTGQTSLTANNVILGNGTSAVQFVAPGSSGNMLVSNGTTWTSSGVSGSSLASVSGAVSPRLYAVKGTCSSSSSILSEIGGTASSIGNISAGVCNITLPGTVFGIAPYCVGSYRGNLSSSNLRTVTADGTTSTNIGMDCTQQGPADCTTYDFTIHCWGTAP